MSLLRGFLFFWYDFLVGDAWDIAVGVLIVLVVIWALVRAAPGAAMSMGPLLALAVIGLTWFSLTREIRGR